MLSPTSTHDVRLGFSLQYTREREQILKRHNQAERTKNDVKRSID